MPAAAATCRGDEEVFDTMRITRHGTTRICEFAFRLAARRAERLGRSERVTNIDKANVFASMAFFARCSRRLPRAIRLSPLTAGMSTPSRSMATSCPT